MTESVNYYCGATANYAESVLADAGFTWSDYHDCWLDDDDVVTCDNGDVLHSDDPHDCCQQCATLYSTEENYDCVVSNDGETFCDEDCASRSGYYLHDDGEWYDRPESQFSDDLGDWCDTNPHLDSATAEKPYRIGVEIEKEDENARESVIDDIRNTRWIAVSDGSLDANGFELVSPAWNLDDWAQITEDLDDVGALLESDTSHNCGGHITVSALGETGPELAERIQDAAPLLYALYRRRLRTIFSPPTKARDTRNTAVKFRAISVKTDRVEFRLFPRVQSRKQLEWRIKLVQYLIRRGRPSIASSLADRFSWLRRHLAEIYSDDQIDVKARLYADFATWYFDLDTTPESVREYV